MLLVSYGKLSRKAPNVICCNKERSWVLCKWGNEELQASLLSPGSPARNGAGEEVGWGVPTLSRQEVGHVGAFRGGHLWQLCHFCITPVATSEFPRPQGPRLDAVDC